MSEGEHVVTAILAATSGELVSRVRFQKTAYLLRQLGVQCGFEYEYHHYGPYSRDLDNAIADAKAFGLVEEDFGHRQSDGAMYSIFRLKPEAQEAGHAASVNGLDEKASEVARTCANTNVTVLELAATAHWLAAVEACTDWETEIRKRKGRKAEGGRLDRALDLLRALNLPPAVPATS